MCSCARVSLSQLFGHLPASSLLSPAALRVGSKSSRTSQVRPSGPVRSGLQRASAQLEEEEEKSASLWRDECERWCEKTSGEVSVCVLLCAATHSVCASAAGARSGGGARDTAGCVCRP